jgi:hypothetical protein
MDTEEYDQLDQFLSSDPDKSIKILKYDENFEILLNF